MDYIKLMEKIKDLGFTDAKFILAEKLTPLPEVRQMCAADKCSAYGKKWNCPPYCGSIEECTAKIRKFKNCIVMNTVTELEDSFDFEGMEKGGKFHGEVTLKAKELFKDEKADFMVLGAGACTFCKECTCPESPCRFPERSISSMEAYGLVVSDVCRACDLKYYNGEGTVTYISCVLFND